MRSLSLEPPIKVVFATHLRRICVVFASYLRRISSQIIELAVGLHCVFFQLYRKLVIMLSKDQPKYIDGKNSTNNIGAQKVIPFDQATYLTQVRRLRQLAAEVIQQYPLK